MKKIMKIVALFLAGTTLCLAKGYAKETPDIIFSAVEGNSIHLVLKNALYPVTEESSRTWYKNGSPISLGDYVTDESEGQSGKLYFKEVHTTDHMSDFSVKDTTKNPLLGIVEKDQMARLYVISKDNIETATLTTKSSEEIVGTRIFANTVTLYINNTPYPNFQSLKFMVGGKEKDSISVDPGKYTYTLKETVTGQTIGIEITGLEDESKPSITSFTVSNANRYALEKTLQVVAEDNLGLDKEPYYFEGNPALATTIKNLVLDGKKASDLEGISWQEDSRKAVYSNGVYTVFVKDKAGNISYKDITVSKISNSTPVISSVTLGKDSDGAVFLDVKASDTGNQPLMYQLNKGSFGTSARLYQVKDGINTITVKNEAGVTVYSTKEVFLDVYTDSVKEFSEENLYNFIQTNPSTWTNKGVLVSMALPDYLSKKVASDGYSINGSGYSLNRSIKVETGDETVTFSVKDVYGKTHTAKAFRVKNIDKEEPSLEVSVSDGYLFVQAKDSGGSGISKITVSSTNATNFTIKSNNSYGVGSDKASYKAPSNGSYQIMVYDFAGNVGKVSATVSSYTENKQVQSLVKNSKTGSEKKITSGSSSIGKKTYEENPVRGTTVSLDNGYSFYSTAGNSTERFLLEPEIIEVFRKSEKNMASPVAKIEQVPLDSTNSDRLKKLLYIVLPLLIVCSVVVVFIVNSSKTKK